ncbi:acyl-protein synthetase [Actinoplanes teichomyceticus]|uniref:Acyl-protein synthetase LuxE n=1 Tax=Actinoplanes teichomyceticus TaxID=1867 RepID=A0A561WSJ9_ACTTI|nr:acyl-protein synthetase [Actinoplanes teichomyceticus]TWG26837.1 acyl-protein synthetase LuxE [Actinoplanes teichomyceticus]GIF15236.1 acyl-protein synthetase [Actinoplanes teichomyceticus]
MSVFTLSQKEKEAALLPQLAELTAHHRARCAPYDRILAASGFSSAGSLAELPWLPVRLFKTLELKSIPDDEVFKVLTSSGTTGDVSRIYLDKAAAAQQQRRLAATVQTVLGGKRLPMLLVDTKAMLKDRRSFSARGAGVLGMSTFGRDHVWALDMDGRVDLAAIRGFLDKHGGEPFLIFGFTFLVWLHLYEVARDHGLDLSNGILIHSGGWKKLVDQAVSPEEFRSRLAGVGLTRVHNYYGMVEQIGTIFLEGPDGGSLYCPDFADVVVRDPQTWAELPPGEPGLLEVVSTLPTSYPGHVLLTEDLGVVHGIDDGAWPGKRFSVLGRLPRAEARGCSDTYREAA